MPVAARDKYNVCDTKHEYVEKNIEGALATFRKLIHPNSNGLVKIMPRNKAHKAFFIEAYKLRCKEVDEKILQYNNLEDLMVSFNSFRTDKRATERNIKELHAIAIDVDYRKIPKYKDRTPMEMYSMLEDYDIIDKEVPFPTIIEWSYQLRLIYVFEKPFVFEKKRTEKQDDLVKGLERIGQVFSERLREYGAEPHVLSSFIRFPRSFNTKNESIVRTYTDGETVTLQQLYSYMPDLPEYYADYKAKKATRKPKKQNDVVYINPTVGLNQSRLNAFVEIQKHLNQYENKGNREYLCFLYRQHAYRMHGDAERSLLETYEFNKGFVNPLPEKEIRSKTKINREYKFKDKTLREHFGEDLCDELEIFGGMTNAEKCKLKRERKKIEREAAGLTKAQEIERTKVKIIELRQQGKKYKEVAEELGLTVDTVKRHIKALKKEGRL